VAVAFFWAKPAVRFVSFVCVGHYAFVDVDVSQVYLPLCVCVCVSVCMSLRFVYPCRAFRFPSCSKFIPQHIFAHLIELSKGLSSTAENSVASPVEFFSDQSARYLYIREKSTRGPENCVKFVYHVVVPWENDIKCLSKLYKNIKRLDEHP